MMSIGGRIKQRRKELQITVEDIAEKLNVSKATIYRYEKGDIEKFPIDLVEPLAKVLKTTPAYLMGWDKNSENDSENLLKIYHRLQTDRQKHVYDYAKNQLKEQNAPTVEEPHIQWILCYGSVSAGTGEMLQDEHAEEVAVTGRVPIHDFAVRVNGDSMEPALHDGEIIYVDKGKEVRNGQMVIADLNGEAYVKKFFSDETSTRLVSLNKKYDDIILKDSDELHIFGVVI